MPGLISATGTTSTIVDMAPWPATAAAEAASPVASPLATPSRRAAALLRLRAASEESLLRDLGGDSGGPLTGRMPVAVVEAPLLALPGSKPTPLPLLKVVVVSSAMFVNSFNTTVLIPFIPFMVEDWGVADPNDVGRYSGFVVASYMLGQMLCSYPIGLAADAFGRKPTLLAGLAGSCLFTLLFGFSGSFAQALAFRALGGCLNGVASITKTTLSEITDSSNQGLAFSILGLCNAVGLVVGPSVGGFLSQPSKKYPSLFPPGSLFDRYAYALPCIIGAAVSAAGFLASAFIVQETKRPAPPPTPLSPARKTDDVEAATGGPADERAPLLHSNGAASGASGGYAAIEDSGRTRTSVTSAPRTQPMSAWELLNDWQFLLTIILYTFISALYIQYVIYDEIFSLWSRMPRSQGGLGFTTTDIGLVFSLGGASLVMYQLFLYAPIERRLGPLKAFRWGILCSLPVFLVLPNTGLLQPAGEAEITWLVWTVVIACQVMRTCAGLQAFTSSFILTANSCASHSRASANGLTQAFGAFSRMVGPVFAGTLFSWSVENGRPSPLDFHLVFYILAVFTLATWAVSQVAPDKVNSRMEEDDEILDDDEEDDAAAVAAPNMPPPRLRCWFWCCDSSWSACSTLAARSKMRRALYSRFWQLE
ncbi:hypothetical protein HK405_012558 [Cladochytrium tenue]|nr:hypothetical protein HK405_012558 [Cladochytrium tenue]